MKNIVTAAHVLISLAVILSILFQPAKVQGLSSAIGGGSETFFGKNKSRTFESKLERVTTISMVLFVITSIALLFLH